MTALYALHHAFVKRYCALHKSGGVSQDTAAALTIQ
jgi:hypothetical protein